MRRALALARLGWGQTAPNPMVGAVVVRDGVVIGEGFHPRFGEPHAETIALAAAGEGARGATLYVTLEPCNHQGKTPPCVDAIVAAGVARVVAAVRDPNPIAAGGAERLRANGVEVEFGDGAAESAELNAPFLHGARGRPWVTLKLACSLDGAIADAHGASRWITGERARREAHRLRANSDAILVGVKTVIADDPELTVRGTRRPRIPPARVVVDPHARLPLESRLVGSAKRAPVIALVGPMAEPERLRALEACRVDLVRGADLPAWLAALHVRGIRSVLAEGGARLAGSLLARGLVDRLAIFHAPVVLGQGALNAFAFAPPADVKSAPRLRVISRRTLGPDMLTILAVDSDVPPGADVHRTD